MVWFRKEDHEARDRVAILDYPDNAVRDPRCVIIEHGRWWSAYARDVAAISMVDDLRDHRHVESGGEPDVRRARRIGCLLRTHRVDLPCRQNQKPRRLASAGFAV